MSRRIGSTFVGVLVLAWLGWGTACAAAEPLPSLDDLLKEYQALGLPLPPKEAKLVRVEAESAEVVEGKAPRKVYFLAFAIKPGTDAEKPIILWSTQELQPSWEVTVHRSRVTVVEARTRRGGGGDIPSAGGAWRPLAFQRDLAGTEARNYCTHFLAV